MIMACWFTYVEKIPGRRSWLSLFPYRPRFCRLMKTQNRRHLRSFGIVGEKSGKSGAFLFSRRVPDFCDGRRSFKIYENSNCLLSETSATVLAHYQSSNCLSQIFHSPPQNKNGVCHCPMSISIKYRTVGKQLNPDRR